MSEKTSLEDRNKDDVIENDVTQPGGGDLSPIPSGHADLMTRIDMKHPFMDVKDLKDQEERKFDKRIVINVGGDRFVTWLSTLECIPGTRLALLAHLEEADESYDFDAKEYFFDRNPAAFSSILNYYRTEELHVDQNVCGNQMKSELDYWGIEEQDIEPCCWSAYSKFADHKETLAALDDDFAAAPQDTAWGEKQPWYVRFRYNMWRLLEDPSSSRLAKVYVIISMMFVMLSIGVFVLETHCMFRIVTVHNGTYHDVCQCKEDKVLETDACKTKVHPSMEYVDYVCFIFFFFEIFVRFIFSMDKIGFLKKALNVIDIICILPYMISLILKAVSSDPATAWFLRAVLALRVIRLLRIFRLMKHYIAFKILVYTIKVSTKELILIVVLLFIGVLIFACLIHIAEKENFDNIPIGFWWALVTMTTVGYGDKYPKKELGYMIGSFCVISGVLTIAFTVPIVVNNFTLYYSHAQSRTKLPLKSRKKWTKGRDGISRASTPGSPEDNTRTFVRPNYIKPPRYGQIDHSETKPEILSTEDDVKINNTNNLDKSSPPDKNIVHIGGKVSTENEKMAPTRHGRLCVPHGNAVRRRLPGVEDTCLEDLEGVPGDIRTISTDSGYGGSKHAHEEESRQLLTEMADADRKRMDERRRQAMLMAQKRDKLRKQRDVEKKEDGPREEDENGAED